VRLYEAVHSICAASAGGLGQPTVEVANDASIRFGCAAFQQPTTPTTTRVISGGLTPTPTPTLSPAR
jgi:hypothetical protein